MTRAGWDRPPELEALRRVPDRSTDDLIRAVAVTTVFGERTVLDGIDLAIRRGEVFVLMGPSGCGKTTMLRHLCGLQRPTLGSVYVCGHDVYELPPDRLHDLRLDTVRDAVMVVILMVIHWGS